ncbi:MAG: hypothetical protein VB082_01245 [Christensenella sp.]|nr:hypothetical protein [Christensenella sp.]
MRHNKIFAIILAVLVAVAFLASGCSSQQIEPDQSPQAQEVDGVLQGGDLSLGEEVNLNDISIEQQGDTTVITMSFLNGSRKAEVSESTISSVPEYEVSVLSAPTRLQVDLKVGFWDYSNQSEWFTDSTIYGMFNTAQSESDTLSVYFQMNENVTASVEENANKLVITLTPHKSFSSHAWFVGLNAYEEYQQNLITPDLGFTPTMCEGLSDIMLISSPKTDEASAKKLAEETNLKIASVAPAKKAYVFEMAKDALPAYNNDADAQAVKDEPVMLINGAPTALPVLVENGRYLCQVPELGTLYARSYVPDASADVEQVLKEKLWVIEANGKKIQLELPDFYGVEKAAASADGRYLAILDSGVENKVLYVYDLQEKVLHNLGEEGFGDETASFVWDPEKDIIYAMTGLGTLQLVKYDFGAAANPMAALEERMGAESKIGYANNKIYFTDKTAGENGSGMIYAVDIGTGERIEIAPGIDFAVSADGKNLAAIQPRQDDEEGILCSVVMIDLATGTQTAEVMPELIADNISLAFGPDGDTLYFTMPGYEGTTPAYPFAILRFSASVGQAQLIGLSKTSKIVPGNAANQLYIIDYLNQAENSFYVTYIYEDK